MLSLPPRGEGLLYHVATVAPRVSPGQEGKVLPRVFCLLAPHGLLPLFGFLL